MQKPQVMKKISLGYRMILEDKHVRVMAQYRSPVTHNMDTINSGFAEMTAMLSTFP